MSDFSQLKSYLDQTSPSSSSATPIESVKTSVLDFFNKNWSNSDTSKPSASNQTAGAAASQATSGDDGQTDSWFKEADTDPYCPKLSRQQRIIGFMTCLFLGAFFMFLASLYIPFIVLKSRKFVLLFSLGSVFFMASFSLLWGVKSHLTHLFSSSRLPFTLSYLGTLTATIYYAMWAPSVLLTLIFAFLQIASLIWYLVSYLPGGQTGLKFFTKIFTTLATKSISDATTHIMWQKSSSLLNQVAQTVTVVFSRGIKQRGEYFRRFGYAYDNMLYKGGMLPRPTKEQDDQILPKPNIRKRDTWSLKKSTFGQNDFIDILGEEGRVSPVDLINGPPWLIGFRGNELQRITRQLKMTGEEIKAREPHKYLDMQKRVKFLMWRYNFKFGGVKK